MKIIDFEHSVGSNHVRFYLGADDLETWRGDDWNDYPWEYNAGRVYDEYIMGFCDVDFPEGSLVVAPRDNLSGTGGVCKLDMVRRLSPCIVVVPPEAVARTVNEWFPDDFGRWVALDGVTRFYFGDQPPEGTEIKSFC